MDYCMSIANRLLGLIKERRLPYSWEDWYQKTRYYQALHSALSKVLTIPPAKCNPHAATEIHLQTSSQDLTMAILALKSFLRFYNDVAIVVHGDHSLTSNSYSLLRDQVSGIKCVSPKDADRLAQNHKQIHMLRQDFLQRFDLPLGFEDRAKSRQQKVFDLHLASKTESVICLDSDTLFLQEPTEIISWIENGDASPFHARPENANLLFDCEAVLNAFPEIRIFNHFNSGLMGFRKRDIPVSLLTKVTESLLMHPEIKIYGDESVWRLIYGFTESKELPFGEYPLFTKRVEFNHLLKNPNLRYLHFLGKHKDGVYAKMATSVINEINNTSRS